MKGERITNEEQLRRWVAGDPVHRIISDTSEECCPNFSCCKPEMLAAPEIRQAFAAADDKTRMKFLGGFLGAMIAAYVPEKKVHVVAGEPGEES